MKRTAAAAALAHVRVSESLPAALERELRAFDAETVAGQDVHVVFAEDAAAVYIGEAELAGGVAHCLRAVDALGGYSTGVVLLLDSDTYRDAAWQLQLDLSNRSKLRTVFVRDPQHAAAIAERMRLSGAAPTVRKPPVVKAVRERREEALQLVPGVAAKRAKTLLDTVGPISKISDATVPQLTSAVGEATAKALHGFFAAGIE